MHCASHDTTSETEKRLFSTSTTSIIAIIGKTVWISPHQPDQLSHMIPPSSVQILLLPGECTAPPLGIINIQTSISVTSDHRLKKARHPVRSALFKLQIGCVVVGWVTTSEFQLLLVRLSFFW
jgi:hypothetical protein